MFDFLKNQKILITGNTGFKGSWLTQIISNYSNKIYGISDSIPTDPSHYSLIEKKKIKQSFIDVCDFKKLNKRIGEIKPNFIFHLAAQSLVKKSYDSPLKTFNTNVIGTLNILESLRLINHDCISIIITSDKSYKNMEWSHGYRENDIIGGKDPYSASKSAAEMVLHGYINSFFIKNKKVKIGIARAGNVIGGGDWSSDRIIPDCISKWQANKTVDVRNPNSTRPWQHVLEPLFGYLMFARELNNDHISNGEVLNFGPDYNLDKTVKELVLELSKHWPKSKYQFKKLKSNYYESNLLKLNCEKAFKLLNWSSILDFKKTIKYTAEWYLNFYKNKNNINNITDNQIHEFTDIYLNKNE